MKKELPIYSLEIIEETDSDVQVDYVALVDRPATQRNFLAFVEPSVGESENDFMQRCIKYVIDEGKEQEQAIAICSSLWSEHFASDKISFDWDETLSTDRGKELLKRVLNEGTTVYIISARAEVTDSMKSTADEFGIPLSRVYAVGSNRAKVEKVKELAIDKHYDNNADVIAALGKIGQKFNQQSFAIQNEDEHIISGALMLADTPIYRNDSNGEYYVTFSKDTIKKIAQKFFKKGFQNNVNLMHDSGLIVEGLTMFESWVTDKKRGINAMKGFEDAPDGSWFGSFKVDNEEVWKLIKEGKVKGFSVEGVFNYRKTSSPQQMWDEIQKIVSEVKF